jgi:hypothetical protein
MANAGNKRRTKTMSQYEQDVLESTTFGETLPNEVIPAINLNNIINPNEIIGKQGDPSDTGVYGNLTQDSLDTLMSTAKIKTKHITNNTNIAINENKISSTLIKPEINSPLAQFNDAGGYVGNELYKKTEVDALLAKLKVRHGVVVAQNLKTFVPVNPGNDPNLVSFQLALNQQVYTHEFAIDITRVDEVVELEVHYYMFLNANFHYIQIYRSDNAQFTGKIKVPFTDFNLGVPFYGALANYNAPVFAVDNLKKDIGANNTPKKYYYRLAYAGDAGLNNIYRNGTYVKYKCYDRSCYENVVMTQSDSVTYVN